MGTPSFAWSSSHDLKKHGLGLQGLNIISSHFQWSLNLKRPKLQHNKRIKGTETEGYAHKKQNERQSHRRLKARAIKAETMVGGTSRPPDGLADHLSTKMIER
jgi:hypothetical protein